MPAVTSPGTRILEETGTSEELAPRYHLILLDDQEHTYQYVILMLGQVFGYSRDKAYAIACMVDASGEAILMTGSRDEVEHKQDQIHAFGADPFSSKQCAGSMTAVLEPAW